MWLDVIANHNGGNQLESVSFEGTGILGKCLLNSFLSFKKCKLKRHQITFDRIIDAIVLVEDVGRILLPLGHDLPAHIRDVDKCFQIHRLRLN